MATDAKGKWIGLGVGDVDDPNTPRNAPNWHAIQLLTHELNRKFTWARNLGIIEQAAYDVLVAKAVEQYCTNKGLPIVRDAKGNAVANVATRMMLGSYPPPAPIKPIIFTVEGHMSDMMAGPAAFTAQELEKQGVCHWQPIGYNDNALPFDDESGIQELRRLVGSQRMDNGIPFPPGTPWGLIIFSQGAIIGCEFMRRYVLAGELNYRLPNLKRALAFGNPERENGQCAPWVPDPPKPGTQGIADTLFNTTRTVLAPIWREHARTGDLYAENTTDEIGLDKTMVYKMVATNDWFGGSAGVLSRVMAMFTNPLPELYDAAAAIIEAMMFAVNMGPHGIYDLAPCVDWMHGVAE